MKGKTWLTAAVCLFLLAILPGCYQPGGPVPERPKPGAPRSYTQEDVDRVVTVELQRIYSPAPRNNGTPPPECDYVQFLRFRPSDGSTLDPTDATRANASRTDAMLVMLPGLVEGANGFEYLGRQLVYAAKNRGLNLEIWAIDRRPNNLEDLSCANYVEEKLRRGEIGQEEAVQTLIDYYYLGKEVNGRKFTGWLRDPQVPFLSEFGLQLATEDVFTVIQHMVPDQKTRKRKVFVGGHSMGGIMTSMFAGWDLDGDPATKEDAGYNNCAGLFGLDTVVTPMPEIVRPFLEMLPKFMYDQLASMTEATYAEFLHRLRNDPNSNRILPMPMINAEAMLLLEALAGLAYFFPDEECTALRRVPYSDSMEILLRFMHSRDFQTYMDGIPRLHDFRYTNEAMLGVVFDDSFAPVGMIQNSMGFLGGGAVVEKSFPMAGPISSIPLVGGLLGGFFGKGPYFIANDAGPDVRRLGRGPLYYWVNFDEIGDESDPLFQDTAGKVTYTYLDNEVSDIRDVARMIFWGPTNLTEWYFSTRLILDQIAAFFPNSVKYGLNFLHGAEAKKMPKIEFIAEQGVISEGTFMFVPVPIHGKIIKGYNHMDVLSACANAPDRRKNEVIDDLLAFVLENVGTDAQ